MRVQRRVVAAVVAAVAAIVGLTVVATAVSVPLVAGLGGRPAGALSLLAVFAAQRPVVAVLSGARGPALIPVLGDTGRVQAVFGVLLAFGLAVSG